MLCLLHITRVLPFSFILSRGSATVAVRCAAAPRTVVFRLHPLLCFARLCYARVVRLLARVATLAVLRLCLLVALRGCATR